MKFTKGVIIGGLLATGMLMMYAESDMFSKNKKTMMKKGKQMMKKLGNW